MDIKMGNGSSILMSDKGESVKSIFQEDNDIITKQAANIKMADFFKLPCQGLITGIDSRCCNADNCDGVSEYDYVENAIDSYDANQALISKQAEQIKMLRSTLIDTLTVVQGGLSSTIANGVKALEETKEHA